MKNISPKAVSPIGIDETDIFTGIKNDIETETAPKRASVDWISQNILMKMK